MLGKKGEAIARKYLEQKGYEFIVANYRTRYGEIDLIMRDDKGIVFVEVKTRRAGNIVAPNDRLSERKLVRLEKVADEYRKKHRMIHWRFLLIGVTKNNRGYLLRIVRI